jgi:hypothetical protein
MAPLNNPRIAWSVALAAFALWATSAPLSWGQPSAGAIRVFDVPHISDSESVATTAQDSPQPADAATPCSPVPGAVAIPAVVTSLLPTPPPPPQAPAAQVPAAASGATSGSQASFHLCGADASASQAIEQLIAGRGFSTSLNTTADGCAELVVRATSGVGTGSATSQLSVSLGSGQSLHIEITSQNGATHVSIASGQ